MAKRFSKKLIELPKTDSRFIDDEGELVKAAVIDQAWKIDHNLVKLLLGDPDIKTKFFDEIEGHWIFNINTFIEYVSDNNFLANSYTRFRNKIGLNIGGKFLRERGEVSLVWPYKDCVLEGGQTREEEKRKEIFFNEILAQDEINRLFDPKVLTNFKRYTVDGKQKVTEIKRDKNGTIKENLIIKGNNLLALHTLKKQFRGKVKLIYIDPPYNTGSDSFGYNDSFNHSSWLTFMKNRLEAGRELLRDDGSIWINIGDEESHYLKVLSDEIFQGGFIANVLWQKRTSPDARLYLGDAHDHILVYAKNEKEFRSSCNPIPLTEDQKKDFSNPDNDRKGPWVSTDFTASGYRPNQMYKIKTPAGKIYKPPPRKCWSKIEKGYLKLKEQGRMWFGVNGDAMPRRKTYLSESKGITPWTWWQNKDVGHNQEAKHESIALFGNLQPFSTPKPERLLLRIINIGSNEGDIVLDFFSGSSTTAAVAHKTKRQFVTIEQMDYIDEFTIGRVKKVIGEKTKKDSTMFEGLEYDTGGISESVNWQGGGDFIYFELMKYNEAYIDKVQAAKSSEELVKIWKDIAKNSFLNWYVNSEMPEESVNDFVEIGKGENGLEKQKKLLAELLNKNQLYVNLSEIDDKQFNVSDDDKDLNRKFYGESYNG